MRSSQTGCWLWSALLSSGLRYEKHGNFRVTGQVQQFSSSLHPGFESQHSASAVASSLAVAVLQFLPSGLRPHLGTLVVLPCLKVGSRGTDQT